MWEKYEEGKKGREKKEGKEGSKRVLSKIQVREYKYADCIINQ